MEKISAVYKIVNTVTGECYVGSSKNVKKRWAYHKCPSSWKHQSNNKLYKNMQKYGVDKFRFQILCPVMPEHLTQVEQELIEIIEPAYNNFNAKGEKVERYKEWNKKYRQTKRGLEAYRKAHNKYGNRLCSYNGETLTFGTLAARFRRAGMKHYITEANKYLIH